MGPSATSNRRTQTMQIHYECKSSACFIWCALPQVCPGSGMPTGLDWPFQELFYPGVIKLDWTEYHIQDFSLKIIRLTRGM